jgi:hypothetical protein
MGHLEIGGNMAIYRLTGTVNTSALDLDQFLEGKPRSVVRDFFAYDVGEHSDIQVSISEMNDLRVELVEE